LLLRRNNGGVIMFEKIKKYKLFVFLIVLILSGIGYWHYYGPQEDIDETTLNQYFSGGIMINNHTLYSGRVFQSPDCECHPCSVWSTCNNGNQVRTCFKCDASTNNMCRYYMDERVC